MFSFHPLMQYILRDKNDLINVIFFKFHSKIYVERLKQILVVFNV